MDDVREQLYVTDRDIFELLVSSKQRLTIAAIRGLARDRNIFTSDKLDREGTADYLSFLPHDHNDLASLIDHAAPPARLEKSTFVEFPPDVTIDEVKDAIRSYAQAVGPVEHVAIPITSKSTLEAKIDYDELDFSRNRLAQRQRKQAQIQVVQDERATVIRLPATEKARAIVEDVRARIAAVKKADVKANQLSLASLTVAADRTAFFTRVISSVPGVNLQTVTNVRVATFKEGIQDDDLDDHVGDVSAEALAIVNKVVLGGENLIATDQFRQLSDAGFFIVGITWRSIQREEPGDLLKISLSFDDPVGGEGIKYAVRHAPRLAQDRYSESFKRLTPIRESVLLRSLEATAADVLKQLVEKPTDGSVA